MTDQLQLLPPFTWRGIAVPVTRRSVSFAHDTVDHKIQYRNGYPVDITGTQAIRFRYSVPMDENIVRGNYPNLFTKTLPALFQAVYDKSPGPLFDPVYGAFTCRPVQFDDELTALLRSGVAVDVEFVRHVEVTDDHELDLDTLQSAESQAGALDQEIVRANLLEPDEYTPPVNLFSQIAGYGRQLEFFANRVVGKLDAIVYSLETIEGAAEALEDPSRTGIIRTSRRLQLVAKKLAARGTDPGKTLRRMKKNADMTLVALASSVGMDLDSFLKLNPLLATMQIVPANTSFTYWATAA